MRYANTKWTKQPFPTPSALAGGGLALIVVVAAWLVLTATPDRIRHPAPLVAQALPGTAAPAIAQSRPVRMVYRNSVIPGGVHSAAELAFALANDPLVAAHYAGFAVASAHVVRVAQTRLVHVSYRVGDKIYWTRNKVRLAAGEELLSDGTHLVRARCGNRIADEPQGPVLDKEPAPEVLDALMVSAEDLVDHAANVASVGNAMLQAPPAATARVAPEERLASILQVGAPGVFVPSLTPSGGRTYTLAPPPVSVHTPPPTPPVSVPTPPPTPSETALADSGVPVSVAPVTVPAISTPPATGAPVPESPADFPLGETIGPQSQVPTAAPPKPAQVPEPDSAVLAAAALAAIALVRRRGRRRPAAQA